jgi:hypothetical protein
MSAAEHDRVQDNVIPIRHTTPAPDPAPAPPVPAVVEPERIKLDIDWRDLLQPPDIWSDDRPSLRKVWLYCRYGDWTRVDGVARIVGAIDALVLILPVFALLYTFLWLWERPARRLIAAAAITLAILILKH